MTALLPAAAALRAQVALLALPEMNALSPAGPAARKLADLGLPVLIGFTVTTLVMWGLVVWVYLRKRGSFAEHAPVDAKGGERWIYVGGFLIPGVTFAAIYVATISVMNSFPMAPHPGHPGGDMLKMTHAPDVRVVGHQWWWEIQYPGHELGDYFATANELHIPAGRPIDVQLVSSDVIHSLWAPRLHGKVDLVPGMDNYIRLQADAPGLYEGGCAEFCGLQHAHMRFRIVAEEPSKYDEWVARQRAHAAEPEPGEAADGKRIFMSGPCAVCHTVRGTVARGSIGPDLTHVAGRSFIAASLPRDVATLHAWVVNAPSLKPGTQMPALTQFTGDELHALVAYLDSLK
jgi:cytochrome c oxidase subunit 2